MSRREMLMASTSAAAGSAPGVPLVPFGPHRISRLIVGGNPVSGNSHVSPALDVEMRDYFTAARVQSLLSGCERAGINTWQSRGDRYILRMLNEHRLAGGRLQWIAQTASELADIPGNIRAIADAGAMGIYHHGTATDRFWKAGKIEQARDRLKVMRDAGVRVGLGTHIPEVIDYAEEKDWDVDFYMTSVYNLGRTREECERLNGGPVQGEYFRHEDRIPMLERVKRTARTCLIFKIYGASRNCETMARKREALDLVFRYAKPHDAIVVGMFPKQSDQVRENCELLKSVLARSS
jgi:hypothetical protein